MNALERARNHSRIISVSGIDYGWLNESTFAGSPCVFLSLPDIHGRTEADVQSTRLSFSDLHEMVRSFQCGLVEILGENPLALRGTTKLISYLQDSLVVLVRVPARTNLRGLNCRVHLLMDVPPPSSCELQFVNLNVLYALWPNCQIRFTVADYNDYKWARELVRSHALFKYPLVFRHDSEIPTIAAQLKTWMIKDGLMARLEPTSRG